MLQQAGKLIVKKISGKIQVVHKNSQQARWTIVIRSAKHWIVSGDLDGQAIIRSVAKDIFFNKALIVPTQSAMYCLKSVASRAGRSVLLACERDGHCHLISKFKDGRMILLDTITDMHGPAAKNQCILSVDYTSKKGELILAGHLWMKMLNICITNF